LENALVAVLGCDFIVAERTGGGRKALVEEEKSSWACVGVPHSESFGVVDSMLASYDFLRG